MIIADFQVTGQLERPTWLHPLRRLRWNGRWGSRCRLVITDATVSSVRRSRYNTTQHLRQSSGIRPDGALGADRSDP
jgi:hypothetical protein